MLNKLKSYIIKNPNCNYARLCFYGCALAMLVFMLLMSRSAGISGDEHFQVDHSEYVYNYYATAGKDTSAIHTPKTNLKYYGQSFDNLTYAVNKWFGVEDIYQSRHLLNSFAGWLLFLATGLTASLLLGWRAGIITMLLAFFSPRLLGHSWNNPKDLPFAMAYSFTIYFLFKFVSQIPRPSIKTMALLSISFAVAISIRIGGLLLLPYMFMLTGLYYLTQKDFYSKTGFKKAVVIILILGVVSLAGYFIGLLNWPYALQNPIKNPIKSLSIMTNYVVSLRQLFQGELLISNTIPWYYAIKYMLITTPIVIFVGIGIFLATLPFRKDIKTKAIYYFFLFFVFAFPIVYTIYKDSNLYGGWRHLLFAYAPIVVISGAGYEFLISKNNKYIKYGTLLILLILLINPLKHIIKNHPYEYVYFNELAGGTKGAYGNYELDYYYHSLQKACEWFIENELGDDTITVATNHGRIASFAFRKNPNVNVEYARYYEKSKENWDYGIFVNTHIDPFQLKNNLFPPAGTIHIEDVDGVPICAVFKRVSYDDYEGFKDMQARKLNNAEEKFDKYLKVNPENEEVIGYKAQIHLMKNDYTRASVLADSALGLNPEYFNAIFIKITACNGLKQYDEALKWSEQIIDIKQDHAETYYQRGFALYHMGKANDALQELQKAVNIKKDYYTAFMLMGEILINYKKYDQAINVIYPKILSFRENDVSANARMALCYYLKKDETNANKILAQIPSNFMNRLDVVKLLTRMDIDRNNMVAAQRKINSMRRINNNSELEVLRAMFSIKLNDLKSANDYLDKAIELDKYNNEARELKNRIKPRVTSNNNENKVQAEEKTVEQAQQQSIMYQKPKKKKRSIFSQGK